MLTWIVLCLTLLNCDWKRSPIQHNPISTTMSTYPVSDFWQSSSCSSRWGRSCIRVSSPTQHWTTLGVSWALCMIFTQDLSMLPNRLASCWWMVRWKINTAHGENSRTFFFFVILSIMKTEFTEQQCLVHIQKWVVHVHAMLIDGDIMLSTNAFRSSAAVLWKESKSIFLYLIT